MGKILNYVFEHLFIWAMSALCFILITFHMKCMGSCKWYVALQSLAWPSCLLFMVLPHEKSLFNAFIIMRGCLRLLIDCSAKGIHFGRITVEWKVLIEVRERCMIWWPLFLLPIFSSEYYYRNNMQQNDKVLYKKKVAKRK